MFQSFTPFTIFVHVAIVGIKLIFDHCNSHLCQNMQIPFSPLQTYSAYFSLSSAFLSSCNYHPVPLAYAQLAIPKLYPSTKLFFWPTFLVHTNLLHHTSSIYRCICANSNTFVNKSG